MPQTPTDMGSVNPRSDNDRFVADPSNIRYLDSLGHFMFERVTAEIDGHTFDIHPPYMGLDDSGSDNE